MRAFNVYDGNLNRIGTIETWMSLLWEDGYNTVGSMQIEVQQKSSVVPLLQIGHYLGRGDLDTLALIRSVQAQDGVIVANGRMASGILGERVSTKVISNENAEAALRGLVSEMDPWECVELGDESGLTDEFARQTSDKTLQAYCEEICTDIDAGFRLRYDKAAKKLLFEVYKPQANQNLVFATKFGNLANIIYSATDNQYKNVAIVAGQGEGEERTAVTVGQTELTGSKRREMYIDARQLQIEQDETEEQYVERLRNHGLARLAEQTFIENIGAEINSADFGKRFKLGDVVTCILDDLKVKLTTRITGFTMVSQNNQTTITLQFGTPIIRR